MAEEMKDQFWLFRHVYHSVVDELRVSTSRRQNSAPQGHRWGLPINKLNFNWMKNEIFNWLSKRMAILSHHFPFLNEHICWKKWKWTVDIVKRSTRGLCEGRTQFLVIADSRSGRSRQRGKRKRFEQEINRDVINRLIQDQTRRSASDQIFEQLVITDWSDGAGNLINWLIWSINQLTNRKEIDRWIERSIGWSIERKWKSWGVVWVGSQFSSSSSRCLRTSTASTTSERQMFRTTARTRRIQN